MQPWKIGCGAECCCPSCVTSRDLQRSEDLLAEAPRSFKRFIGSAAFGISMMLIGAGAMFYVTRPEELSTGSIAIQFLLSLAANAFMYYAGRRAALRSARARYLVSATARMDEMGEAIKSGRFLVHIEKASPPADRTTKSAMN